MDWLRKMVTTIKNPLRTIEFIVALGLIIFGVYIMIPIELLPWSIYGNNCYKAFIGLLVTAPAWPIVITQISTTSEAYDTKVKRRKRSLFWISVTYFYLAALRIIAIGWLPLIWVALSLIGSISTVLYLRLKN